MVHSWRWTWMACLTAAASLGTGCGGYQRTCGRPPTYVPVNGSAGPGADVVRVVYLGSGGVLIARGKDVVLTVPLFSNPTAGEIAWQDIASDQRQVDAYLRRYKDDLAEADGILSGHSHYDHLLDAPHVASRWATAAPLYGNAAMAKVLAGLPALAPRLVSVEGRALAHDAPEEEGIALSPSIGLYPVLSEHSPQFPMPKVLGVQLPAVHLWRGEPALPLTQPPRRAGDWPEGTTLAYVIEFAGGAGARPFRVYYQDSPARLPFGQPPEWLRNRGIDLAILCVGGSEVWPEHPADIAALLRPANVLAIHWEDFLNPRPLIRPDRDAEDTCPRDPRKPGSCETTRAVPSCDPKKWLNRLRPVLPASARYLLPCPDAQTDFRLEGNAWIPAASTEPWAEARASR